MDHACAKDFVFLLIIPTKKQKENTGLILRRHKCHPGLFVESIAARNNADMNGKNVFDIRSLFSRNLKRLRNAADLSQLALAGQADLTHNFINDIENGKKWVSDETIGKLATALQVEPYQFFLSESRWDERGKETLAVYMDEVTDSVMKALLDHRRRYMSD